MTEVWIHSRPGKLADLNRMTPQNALKRQLNGKQNDGVYGHNNEPIKAGGQCMSRLLGSLFVSPKSTILGHSIFEISFP